MQDASDNSRFKTFADSVSIISKLGQRLAGLQNDVAAIESLPVDANGDAEASVSIGTTGAARVELRLPPSAMLLVKREEVSRAIDELKSEFNEILDHASELALRCKPEPVAPMAPRIAADVDVLERMEREMKELERAAGPQRGSYPSLATETPPPPPSRVRGGSPRLRDMVFNRRPAVAAE